MRSARWVRVVLGVGLAAAAVAGGSAYAQDAAPQVPQSAQGTLHVPSAAERAAAEKPAPPPRAAPRAGVQQTAPFSAPMPTPSIVTSHGATGAAAVRRRPQAEHAPSSLGRSAPGHTSALDRREAARRARAHDAKAHSAKPAEVKPEAAKPQPAPAQNATPTTAPLPQAPASAAQPASPAEAAVGSSTHLPIPRWASFKTDEVNMRSGPGMQYPIQWVYHRLAYPVLIEREFDVWRLIEDEDGVKGWVHTATLTNRRSFVVRPGPERQIRSSASDDSSVVARLQPGVVGRVHACEAQASWCEVQVKGNKGWLKRADLYGVDPGEAITP